MPPSRKGTRGDLILKALTAYRLIDPGSERRLHRQWYLNSALGDLLGAGYELAEIHKLYSCLDHLRPHKRALFDHRTKRWKNLFNEYDTIGRFPVSIRQKNGAFYDRRPAFNK